MLNIKTIFLLILIYLLSACKQAVTAVPASATVPAAIESVVPINTWNKTYGGQQNDEAWDVLLASDGGYFIVGATNVIYEPEMQGDIYLIRTDATGNAMWEKTYGGPGYDTGQGIFMAKDGSLMIVGYTNSFGAGGLDGYLINVDQDGNELWTKTFGGPLDEMTVALQLKDDRYILAGNQVDPNDFVADPSQAGYGGFAGRSNIYISNMDSSGKVLWEKTYGGDNNLLISRIIQTPDGGSLILANIELFPEPGHSIYLLKVDRCGNDVWSKTWEEGALNAYDLIATTDGNYLITGSYTPSDVTNHLESDALFIKIDPAGNEIWRRTLGDPGVIENGRVAIEDSDGGFVVAGDVMRNLTSWSSGNIAIFKIDSQGELIWKQTIETKTHSMIADLSHLQDGYIVTGSMWRSNQWDVFMIKTSSEGIVVE